MKIIYFFILFIFTSFFISCEKVVDIDLNETEPHLVVDAVIRWQKGTTGNEQLIKVSLTNDFYTSDILAASGAQVTITNSANQVFTFEQEGTSENYICTDFIPEINESYTLKVFYNGEVYTATNTLLATPSISHIEQDILDSFGEDIIRVKFFFQDDATTTDYYLLGVLNPNKQIPEFGILDDEYSQGQELFGYYASSETESGITLWLSVQNITTGYYDYMNKLLPIAASDSNPFATTPGTLRGNIINESNFDNFAYGYFHLAEIDAIEYVVE